jgi:hypothetical protein
LGRQVDDICAPCGNTDKDRDHLFFERP